MLAAFALLAPSCLRTPEDDMNISALPEGAPITMRIDFGASDLINLDVSTKAEATPADEERIHDLYVMIFCDGEGQGHQPVRGQKIYGRYFSYEHLESTLADLDNSPNEGWWVENRTIPDPNSPESTITKTRGAVKISTKVCSEAIVVVVANIDNGVCKLGKDGQFGNDMLAFLNGIRTYEEFRQTQVKLTQEVVNRKDLFLMMGFPEDGYRALRHVNTGDMIWGTNPSTPNYNSDYKINLRAVDAKVKFKVRINDPNNYLKDEQGNYILDESGNPTYKAISAAKAVYWEVDKTPDRCYLFSDANGGNPPRETVYFDTEPAYFEGQDENGWYYFSFYMLESRFAAKAHAESYHDRERQVKTETNKAGYHGGGNFVENGEWIYAMPNAPYVKFDMILTLTPEGVKALGGNVNHALTSDTIYSIHLGDFSNSGFDDYNTFRSTCYTYEITIANSGSIYAEVKNDQENQPGQEGYLLLTDDEIVNADAHYEYHAITFYYDAETTPEKFSWYVKTPFTSQVGGGPQKGTKIVNGKSYPIYDPHDSNNTLLDYRWVKFSINEPDPSMGYSTRRVAYPGDNAYNKSWGDGEHGGPWDGTQHPTLMDISQLIQYIFQETDKERATPGSSDFKTDNSITDSHGNHPKVIRATIFIDEYYYETDPRDESANPQVDPNLWRQFVNAQPREMHILSKTVQSRDRKSDVIESSHSVIQQSIQTIYNIFEPTLRSIWGCEHLDEIKYTTVDGQPQSDPAGNWTYWPAGCSDTEKAGVDNAIGKENGRLNSAYIWGLYSSQGNGGQFYKVNDEGKRFWKHFLKYEVNNSVPELRNDADGDTYGSDDGTHKFRGMAWSCLTRNRDNNGNGRIDEEEVRWYLAASQQLAGIWVGTESLSTSARLYQPTEGEWRAHVVSSTAKLVSWSEEGGGATDIKFDYPPYGGPATPYHTWASEADASVGESVRCIRNVGTYDGPGGVTDISYAPVTVLPDKYFTLERHSGRDVNAFNCAERDGEDANDYFIFHFDRLNTKSIREYSPGELPYHDQMSMNNRVYKKIITQPLSEDVPQYNVKLKDINNLVTQAGHNDYCPEGYRFPNHTEWLLMSLYLPANYLKKDADGNNYSPSAVDPSRTYYDRGFYGSLRSESAAWSTEKDKVGWIFSDKMHCSPTTQTVNHSRCIKDEDQTGVISGKIAIEGNVIYPGDLIPIDFMFSSTASSFKDATLTLRYRNGGLPQSYDLTSQLKTPTGLQYKGVQYIKIPTLADLGLSVEGLPYNNSLAENDMAIEVELTNQQERSGGHRLAVKMVNPLDGQCSITDATDGKVYPHDKNTVTLQLSTKARTVALSSVSLKLCYDDVERDIIIPALGDDVRVYNQTNLEIDIPALAQLSGISESDLLTGKTAHLEATVKTKTSNTETLEKTVSSADFTLSHPIVATTFTIDTDNDEIYPGDSNTVSLEFASQGHAPINLSTVTVQMYNTDGVTPMGGLIVDRSGIAAALFSSSGSVTIPTLAALGLDVSALDQGTDYTLRALVTNEDGLSRTIDKTLTLSNPISGSFSVPAGYVYAADDNTLNFNVSSQAKTSTLTAVSFKLTYTGIDGDTHNVTSGFSGPSPSGKEYSGDKTVSFPMFTQTPETDAPNLSLPVTVTATFTDDGGITKDITVNIPSRSHINAPILQIPEDYTGSSPSYVFPVKAKLGAAVGGYAISAMKLQWKKNGETVWTTDTYDFDESNADFQTVSDASTRASLSLSTGAYINYRAMSICSTDGTVVYSPVWSMYFQKYDYQANQAPWIEHFAGMSIAETGAFIQAKINTSQQNIKNKGELLGVGTGSSEDVFTSSTATPKQTISAYWRNDLGSPKGYLNLRFGGQNPDISAPNYCSIDVHYEPNDLQLLYNKDGIYYNGTALSWPGGEVNSNGDRLEENYTNIVNASDLMIGSKQGSNRSNSYYHFIRIVRQYEIPEP